VFVGIVAVLTIGMLAYSKISSIRDTSARNERIANGLATVHRCLLGAPGRVDAADQLRMVDLANRARPTSPPWPARCKDAIHLLADDASDPPEGVPGRVHSDASALESSLDHLEDLYKDPPDRALERLEAASALLPGTADLAVPLAPSPAPLLPTPQDINLPFPGRAIASISGKTIWIADAFGHDLCRFDPDRAGNAARVMACTHVAREGNPHYTGAADGAPMPAIVAGRLFLVDSAQPFEVGHVLVQDTKPLAVGAILDAFAWSKDLVDVATFDRGKLVLDRYTDGTPKRLVIDAIDGGHVSLAGGALLWAHVTKDGAHARVLLLDSAHDPQPAATIDLGKIEATEWDSHPACTSPHVTAIAFGTQLAIAFDGKWQALRTLDRVPALVCRDRDVVVDEGNASRICGETGCQAPEPARLPGPQPTNAPQSAAFGLVDDQRVSAWSTRNGDALYVRIGAGPASVLLTDRSHYEWRAAAIVSMPHGALIVLQSDYRASILRVDADGTIVDASAGS
jgi:hypothetical protein